MAKWIRVISQSRLSMRAAGQPGRVGCWMPLHEKPGGAHSDRRQDRDHCRADCSRHRPHRRRSPRGTADPSRGIGRQRPRSAVRKCRAALYFKRGKSFVKLMAAGLTVLRLSQAANCAHPTVVRRPARRVQPHIVEAERSSLLRRVRPPFRRPRCPKRSSFPTVYRARTSAVRQRSAIRSGCGRASMAATPAAAPRQSPRRLRRVCRPRRARLVGSAADQCPRDRESSLSASAKSPRREAIRLGRPRAVTRQTAPAATSTMHAGRRYSISTWTRAAAYFTTFAFATQGSSMNAIWIRSARLSSMIERGRSGELALRKASARTSLRTHSGCGVILIWSILTRKSGEASTCFSTRRQTAQAAPVKAATIITASVNVRPGPMTNATVNRSHGGIIATGVVFFALLTISQFPIPAARSCDR